MYKARLHELAQKKRWDPPIYITGRNGPCHLPRFSATVTVQDQVFGTPEECKSIKEAHNSAARIAFEHFNSLPPVAADGTAPPPAVNSQIPPQITTADTGGSTPTADTGGSIPAAAPPAEMQPIVDVLLPSPLPSSLPSPPLGLLMKRIDAVIEPANREVLQENHADTKSSAVSTEPANGEVLKENCEDAQASAANLSVGSHDEGREGLLMKIIDAVIEPANQEVLQENHADTKTSAVITELANGEVLKENHEDAQASEANLSVGSHDEGREGLLLKENHADAQASAANISIGSRDEGHEARLSMYKSQLQQYAQRNKLCLPAYTTEAHGPPHNSRFKSKVCIDGKSYETPELFSTLKEAEQVAAKIACQALSVAVVQEDGGFSKNILQQLVQKKGLLRPSYETVSSGMPHSPIFVSSVTIGTDIFRGDEAKTKKQAEINAARVAYFALTKDAVTNSSKVPTTTVRKHQDTANEGPERDAKRAKASVEG